MATTVEVSWFGDEDYSGWDGDTLVAIDAGGSAKVSADKAAQLFEDFPQLAALKGQQPVEGPKPLEEWSKADLDAFAAENDVPEYPSGRRAKVADKVAAINAFKESAVEEDEGENDELEMPEPEA